jgi:hypothetical protein
MAMRDAKHTPGPWRVEDIGSRSDTLHIVARPDRPAYDWQFIATVSDDFENGVDWGQTVENARLIAAAPLLPELAEALRELLKVETAGVRFESLDWNRRAERFTAHHRAESALARYEETMEAGDA